jgi:exosortase K
VRRAASRAGGAIGDRRVKTKLCVLAVALATAWGLKRYYADARADDLWWMLTPTATLAGAMANTQFVAEAGQGYLSRERLFLIEKSCAGINFMIGAFGMLAFVLHRRIVGWLSGARVLIASLVASYAAAVLVNAVRVAIAVWLTTRSISAFGLSNAQIHRIEGVAVYFGGLFLLYVAATSVRGPAVRRVAMPLGFYYGIALVVPLANGAAARSELFRMHALVVLVLPPAVILLAWTTREIGRWLVQITGRPRCNAV